MWYRPSWCGATPEKVLKSLMKWFFWFGHFGSHNRTMFLVLRNILSHGIIALLHHNICISKSYNLTRFHACCYISCSISGFRAVNNPLRSRARMHFRCSWTASHITLKYRLLRIHKFVCQRSCVWRFNYLDTIFACRSKLCSFILVLVLSIFMG